MFRRRKTVLALSAAASISLALASPFVWEASSDEPPSEAIQQSIRNALNGQGNSDSDEPLLQDVLDLIKDRGSILDGSLLDVESKSSEPDELAAASAHCRAAEALLKAARLLENLSGDLDQSRTVLVRQMRSQASDCLKEALR